MAAKAIFCLRIDGEGVVGSIVVNNVVYKYFVSIVRRQEGLEIGSGLSHVLPFTIEYLLTI
jgi:hypothetical protein